MQIIMINGVLAIFSFGTPNGIIRARIKELSQLDK